MLGCRRKHRLLTISLSFGAKALSADEKAWVCNITEVRVPMLYLDTDRLWHTPKGVSFSGSFIETLRSIVSELTLCNYDI